MLVDPTLFVLQTWAIVVIVPDSDQDASGFTRLGDCHYLVGLGVVEVLLSTKLSSRLSSSRLEVPVSERPIFRAGSLQSFGTGRRCWKEPSW